MNEIGLLIQALIRDNPHETLTRDRKFLEYAYKHLRDEPFADTMRSILYYDQRLGKCPDTLVSLLQFVQSNFDKKEYFEQKGKIIEEEITELQSDKTPVGEVAILMEAVYQQGLEAHSSNAYMVAAQIVSGGMEHPKTKEKGKLAAEQYLHEEKEKMVIKGPKVISGDLKTNADHIQNIFDSYILSDSSRIFTKFGTIDTCVIGRRQPNRWIGILGYTNHGKSLLLLSLIYNMAMSGKNVLLVPREVSVDEAYMQLAYLHASNFPELELCSRAKWIEAGSTLDPKFDTNMKKVIRDLKNGTLLQGKIIVEPLESWGEIEEYMQATVDQVDYDVLAIDYFTHLMVKGRDEVEEHKKDFRKAQMLTRNGIRNDKSGLVIVTPLQANKKGHDEAAKQEGDKIGEYQSLGAIDWYTQAAQDMDMVISVWFEGDNLKEVTPPNLMLRCMKARGGPLFAAHKVELNETLGYICDKGTTIKVSSENITSNMTDSEANYLLYPTDGYIE